MESAPHMCPTENLGHHGGPAVLGLVERPEAGVSIGMQEAAEAGQVPARMLAFAIRRVAIEHGRRRWPSMRPLVAQADP